MFEDWINIMMCFYVSIYVQKRRMNRTLTQKYDMGALRALQKLETEFLLSLAAVYGCEEDDVPIELDLLHVYNMEESLRLGELVR